MKKFTLAVCLLVSAVSFAQQDVYDKIILDGKEVYMSRNTGEIYNTKPKGAYKPKAINRYETTNDGSSYTVEKGDTLYAISRRFGISVSQLCAQNGISVNDTLRVGQELSVGGSSPSREVSASEAGSYIVEKGDTLYSIARRNGLSVQTLKDMNGLTSNLISVGQSLRVN